MPQISPQKYIHILPDKGRVLIFLMEGLVNNKQTTSSMSFEYKEDSKSLDANNVDTNNTEKETQLNEKKPEDKPDNGMYYIELFKAFVYPS